MSERTFDPEVVALLQEVARDSGSTLLRLPKQPLVKWVGRPEEVISPQGSHLSKVERHLVEAYREEAAWVLEQACVAQLTRLPLVFTPSTTDPKLLASKARRLVRSEAARLECESALVLIAEGREVDAVHLGVSSVRLSPRDSARNALAVALQMAGQHRSAMWLLRRLLLGEPATTQRAHAFENLAYSWASRQDFAKAFEYSVRASRTDESKIRFLVWCLTSALQDGKGRRAMEYAARLDAHPARADLAYIAAELEAGRASGQWRATAKSRTLISRLRSEVALPVRGICDAFA